MGQKLVTDVGRFVPVAACRSAAGGVLAVLVVAAGLTGCADLAVDSSDAVSKSPAPDPMPELVGSRLDVAISDLEALGVDEDDVEIVGGGTFGVLNESNWEVCEQRPAVGSVELVNVRLIVERECPEPAASDDVEAETEIRPDSDDTPALANDDAIAVEEEPESPAIFITSARRDLRDMRKDLKDLKAALDEGSILRVAGNQVELAFNLGQLSSRVPPESYSDVWATRLETIDAAVEAIDVRLDGDGSPRSVVDAIDVARSEVRAGLDELKAFEESLDE